MKPTSQVIRGTTRLLGVIGWPIEHSLSPTMQGAAIQAAGLDIVYVPLPVHPDRLAAAVRGLSGLGFLGANVTIPHKESVAPLMDRLTPEAAMAGAVNTIRIEPDGSLLGHNTDIGGVLSALDRELSTSPEGQTVAIIGCGGAGRAAAFACAKAGAEKIFLLNRSAERASRLAKDLTRQFPGARAEYVALTSEEPLKLSRIVLHMTSLGLKVGDPMPINPAALHPEAVLLDAVTTPGGTPLVQAALGRGLRATGGRSMLVEQGAVAFEFWTSQIANREAMHRALVEMSDSD